MKINFINVEDIIDINSILEKESDGILKPNELESSVYSIRQCFGGNYLYNSVFEMTSHLICSLTWSHVFQDGNKRTSVLSGLRFLEMNNVKFNESKQTDLAKKIVDVTEHKMSEDELIQYLVDNCN